MKKIIKNILQLLNTLSLIALCLSYFSNYINPARIWGIAFFGLAFQYLFIINIVFFLFWWWRKNKFAIAGLLVLIVGIGYTGRFMQFKFSGDSSIKVHPIRVLSYNVRIFNYFEWEGKRSYRDSIISFLQSEQPGIICLQEFFTRADDPKFSENNIKQKLRILPYTHIDYSYSVNKNNSKFGIATFSRYPIINKGKIQFRKSFNACIFSDIKINNDTVRVYNIHLQSISLKKDNYALMDSIFYLNSKKIDEVKDVTFRLKAAYITRAEQTDAITKHINTSPYPVILCGDFNDTPVSYTYHQLRGDKKDAYRESGTGFGNTYRGNLPSFRIDYIFYSGDFTSFNYETRKIKLSDHYPVTTDLVLER